MLDIVRAKFTASMNHDHKVNLLREHIQLVVLKVMSDKKLFDYMAFFGGTALRIVYNVKRFSEDLDFSLINAQGYAFNKVCESLVSGLRGYGFDVETKQKQTGAVHSIYIRFPNILKEMGLFPMASQKLAIKWEIDTNPPAGAVVTHTILSTMYLYAITHYDTASMFAGKIHACLFRSYVKGRDWYDFAWYLSQKTMPNFTLLNNAIAQTQGTVTSITKETLKDILIKRVRGIDFVKAADDVHIFLEDERELSVLNADAMCAMLEAYM